MLNYLCELGCEEIPARFIPSFCENFRAKTQEAFRKNQIPFQQIKLYATPRRIALLVEGLSDQKDLVSEVKGPPCDIAFDANRRPLPPAVGFAKKLNISVDQLTTITENGKDYLFAKIQSKGKNLSDVLPVLIPDIILSLDLPIAMKWGAHTQTFIRPIHWILSLLDTNIIPFNLFGITAGQVSYGHRFLTQNSSSELIASGQAIVMPSVSDYISLLKENFVVVDPVERRDLILKGLLSFVLLSTDEARQQFLDEALLEEVVYLVEYPVAIMGSFDTAYLEIPQEILIQFMKKNLKAFPVFKDGHLSEKFMIIADNVCDQNKKTIRIGNQNVLRARLEDASFFWCEDKKIPLESNLEKLKSILFQKNMGSLFDKTQRIIKLSAYLTTQLNFNKEQNVIARTALLCKADLASHMVVEIPSLQGVMGMLYARYQGETEAVAFGIFEHYLPRFSADRLPQSVIGIVVGLADKLDTLSCCFLNGLIPTGTQDPWGLRRISSGILQIILEKQLSVKLSDILFFTFSLLSSDEPKVIASIQACQEFMRQRLKNMLLDDSLPYDVVDAVLPVSANQPYQALYIAKILQEYLKQNPEKMKLICETAVRVKRLSKQLEVEAVVDPTFFKEEAEQICFNQLSLLQSQKQAVSLDDLAAFSPLLTRYFDKVLVMDSDEAVRKNRLSFLRQVHGVFWALADFEAIQL